MSRPASEFDGSHISQDVRDALKNLEPQFRAGIERVADEKENHRENGNGRPAVGTPARR